MAGLVSSQPARRATYEVARGDRKVLAPVRFVGSYQDAFGRHDGVDQQQRRAPAAIRKQAAVSATIIARYP
jgi:hypothetical protein